MKIQLPSLQLLAEAKAPKDEVVSAVKTIINTLTRSGPEKLLAKGPEDDSFKSGTDAQNLAYFVKKRVPGVSNFKSSSKKEDGEQCVSFTFTADGKSYKGNWFPEAGSSGVSQA
jgi:hypothetical protein